MGHVFSTWGMVLACRGVFLTVFCMLRVFWGAGACSRGTEVCSWRVLGMSLVQPWLSDPEDAPFLDPALRKRAVKVKHVKRREKKSDKKVGPDWEALGGYWELLGGCWGALGVTERVTGRVWWALGGTGRPWVLLGVTGGLLGAAGGFWWALGGAGG